MATHSTLEESVAKVQIDGLVRNFRILFSRNYIFLKYCYILYSHVNNIAKFLYGEVKLLEKMYAQFFRMFAFIETWVHTLPWLAI